MHHLVVLGGSAPPSSLAGRLPTNAFVIAADSGVDHAFALGLTVNLAVGDMDSISPAGLAELTRRHVPMQTHPCDKDATDGELALLAATDRGVTSITIVTGANTDRLDHLLATIALICQPTLRYIAVDAWCGHAHLWVLHAGGGLRAATTSGEVITLLPSLGDAVGVTTSGLKWPLANAVLPSGSSRGVSNIATGAEVRIVLATGSLLVISPEALP